MLQIIAHRGARSMAPENTILAAQIAKTYGADLWETDVTLTRDQHLVLFHDKTLLRCTDAVHKFPGHPTFCVQDFDLSDLLELDTGSWFLEKDPFGLIALKNIPADILSRCDGARIPTLEQGLEFTRNNNWQINLELKDHNSGNTDTLLVDLTLDTIKRSGLPPEYIRISSFNHDWLRHIRKNHSEYQIEALLGDDPDAKMDFGNFEFDTYNLNAQLTDVGMIKMLKKKNKTVNLYTVNESERFHYFQNAGADGIFTDFPQQFKSAGEAATPPPSQ